MKKWIIIAGTAVLFVLIAIGTSVVGRGDQLQSSARKSWKQKRIAEIAARVAGPMWHSNELVRLRTRSTADPGVYESWLSDRLITAQNGEWLTYANICRKEDRRIHDLFLARGSDGKWYYSTYHFCIGVVVLRMEEQPEDLAGFAKAHFLRTFDGQSDECLKKTWPADSR